MDPKKVVALVQRTPMLDSLSLKYPTSDTNELMRALVAAEVPLRLVRTLLISSPTFPTHISDVDAHALAALLAYMPSLTDLVVSDQLSPENTDELLAQLRRLPALRRIAFSSRDLAHLASGLRELTGLTSLDIRKGYHYSNKFGEPESTALSSCLESLTALTSLRIGNADVTKLSRGLLALTGLKDLNLSDNRHLHGPEAQQHLARALAAMTGLKGLDLYDSPGAVLALPATLSALTRLDIGGCRLSDSGVDAAVSALVGMEGLRHLVITGCESKLELLLAVKRLTSLETLDMSYIFWSNYDIAQAARVAFNFLPKLRDLKLLQYLSTEDYTSDAEYVMKLGMRLPKGCIVHL